MAFVIEVHHRRTVDCVDCVVGDFVIVAILRAARTMSPIAFSATTVCLAIGNGDVRFSVEHRNGVHAKRIVVVLHR